MGRPVGGSDAFASRELAESWMSESWAELLAQGAVEVELLDLASGASLYRMSLEGDPSA